MFDQTLEGIQTRGDGDQMRIIWTERGETPMIWFIWKRDRISCWVHPIANVPLKIHSATVDTLARLAHNQEWTPPLNWTTEEEATVNKSGTLLLLRRSGTGKTLCVCAAECLGTDNSMRMTFVNCSLLVVNAPVTTSLPSQLAPART
jgi:hypothetical protein